MVDIIKKVRPILEERLREIGNDAKEKITKVVFDEEQRDRLFDKLEEAGDISTVSSNTSTEKRWLEHRNRKVICQKQI